MGASYGQFCPVAKALEVLDERWTLLIVRELVSGSRHFNELRRGVPRMSPSLLSSRLNRLVRAGVLERRPDGNRVEYLLTEAGQELRSVVEALGHWGVRWIPELGDEDLDPHLLMWDMRRNIDHDAVPERRTVVRFGFSDVPPPTCEWWLVITSGEADVCDDDPGFPATLDVTTTLRRMTQIWRGDLSWSEALRTGELEVHGPEPLRRAMPGWFKLSLFAPVPRPQRTI